MAYDLLFNEYQKYHSDFIISAAKFGGVLDIQTPYNQLDKKIDLNAVENTRHLFCRPIKIFSDILENYKGISPQADQFINRTHFGYLFSVWPNAHCWHENDKNYLGMTSGLGHFIHMAVSNLLSHKNFMADYIEGAEEEKICDPDALRNGLMIDDYVGPSDEFSQTTLRTNTPISPERMILSYEIAHQAIVFVFMHELAHAILGHSKFLNERLGAIALDEAGAIDSQSDIGMLKRYFETQADGLAVRLFLSSNTLEKFSPKRDGWFSWSFGVDLLLWLFSQFDGSKKSEDDGDHPHPHSRIWLKTETIEDMENKDEIDIKLEVSSTEEVKLSAFCLVYTKALSEAWMDFHLPGADRAIFGPDASNLKNHKDEYLRVMNHESTLRKEFDDSIDWSLVSSFMFRAE